MQIMCTLYVILVKRRKHKPLANVVDAWDNENEATDDEEVEEDVWFTRAPGNVVSGNVPTLGDETKFPDDTGCEFLSIIATGDGEPELVLIDDE